MKKEDLRIVFMGTPEFAVATLQALVEDGYNVVAVVTQPDKPVGRHGSILQAPAVKQYALTKGLPVLQPEKMKDPDFIEHLRKYDANLQVVVAFRMLPEVVWNMPKYGTFNVHASLLPQYRGAAPINWAIINGEEITGVTTFFLNHEIDTGRIIMQKNHSIGKTDNAEDLYNALMVLGADACIESIHKIIDAEGYPETIPQPKACELHHAPKIFKDTCRIDWKRSAKEIYDFIRGLSPMPGAWTTVTTPDGKETVLKIYKASLDSGSTYNQSNVMCGDGNALRILELQLAGKKKMSATDFLNGNKNILDTIQ